MVQSVGFSSKTLHDTWQDEDIICHDRRGCGGFSCNWRAGDSDSSCRLASVDIKQSDG